MPNMTLKETYISERLKTYKGLKQYISHGLFIQILRGKSPNSCFNIYIMLSLWDIPHSLMHGFPPLESAKEHILFISYSYTMM